MKLSDFVIKYREEHGLSQRQLAQKCDLSNGYISMLEKGINPSTGLPLIPTLANVKKLASGMGMTMNDLLPLIDDVEVNIDEMENILNSTTQKDSGMMIELLKLFISLPDEGKRNALEHLKYLAWKSKNPEN